MSNKTLYDIQWTHMAVESFNAELDFIALKWNNNEVNKFINLVDEFILRLSSGIIKGKISQKMNINSFLISKQTTIFFEIEKSSKLINILLFWNNKRNPKDLKSVFKRF